MPSPDRSHSDSPRRSGVPGPAALAEEGTSLQAEKSEPPLQVFDFVEVHGLVKAPEYNGKRGRIYSKRDDGRFGVYVPAKNPNPNREFLEAGIENARYHVPWEGRDVDVNVLRDKYWLVLGECGIWVLIRPPTRRTRTRTCSEAAFVQPATIVQHSRTNLKVKCQTHRQKLFPRYESRGLFAKPENLRLLPNYYTTAFLADLVKYERLQLHHPPLDADEEIMMFKEGVYFTGPKAINKVSAKPQESSSHNLEEKSDGCSQQYLTFGDTDPTKWTRHCVAPPASLSSGRVTVRGWPPPPWHPRSVADLPFEVKEVAVEGQPLGVGLFATRKLKKNEVICTERPLLEYQDRSFLNTDPTYDIMKTGASDLDVKARMFFLSPLIGKLPVDDFSLKMKAPYSDTWYYTRRSSRPDSSD